MNQIDSLKKKITNFESSIHHTRSEMIQLSSKLQLLIFYYDDCNSKLTSLLMKSVPVIEETSPKKYVELFNVMGIGDRVVITIRIKFPSIKPYTLDAQIDSSAMSSCCKYKAIPHYYWQPTKLQFRAITGDLMEIGHIAPEFPILLNDVQVFVTLYSFDTCVDILLGQDFLKKYLRVTFRQDYVIFSTTVGHITVPASSD